MADQGMQSAYRNAAKSVKRALCLLVEEYMQNPNDFFSERELHSAFFRHARPLFPGYSTNDQEYRYSVSCFRQEYNTTYRYKRKTSNSIDDHGQTLSFQRRYENEGSPGSFDFAILAPDFIRDNPLLSVINKDERRRKALRRRVNSRLLFAIEFKMGHIRSSLKLNASECATVIKGMKEDARKCRNESPAVSVLLGFFHDCSTDCDPNVWIREIEEEHGLAPSNEITSRCWIYLIFPNRICKSNSAPEIP